MSILVQLPDAAETFVEEQVAAGRFSSASEFIANLVEEARLNAARRQLEKLLLEGIDSGTSVEITTEYRQKRKEELSRKYDRVDKP